MRRLALCRTSIVLALALGESACSATGPDASRAAPGASATVMPAAPSPAPRARVDPSRDAEEAPTPDETAAMVAKLRALAADPAPARTTNDKHYLVSNERRLDLYRPDVDDLGGTLIGVGTDQNYILAGFVAPELLIIVDFDQKVVDLHAVHGALIGAAADADDFRRLWGAAGRDDAHTAIAAAFADPAHSRAMAALYDEARAEVDARFVALRKRYAELGIRAWLEEPEEWQRVATLHREGRVVAIRGDFTKAGVLREIAAVLREHEQIVRVLYLSNIEQYLTYKPAFRETMLALPFDDRSLVLRTLPGKPAGFQYILQHAQDFQAWMRAPGVWSVYRMRGLIKGESLVASERFFITRLPSQR